MKTKIEFKTILSVSLKSLILIFGVLGVILAFAADDFLMIDVLMYFTVQSNIIVVILSGIFLFLELYKIKTKRNLVNQTLLKIKYALTVAITLTLIIFFSIIAPFTPVWFAFNAESIMMHLIVPILTVTDFFLFDFDVKLTNKTAPFYTVIFPFCYFIYTVIFIYFNFTFFGSPAPYYFLDYRMLGWFTFSQNGPGTFYWIIFLMSFILGLSYLYKYLIHLRKKAVSNTQENKAEKGLSYDEAEVAAAVDSETKNNT